MFTTSETTDLRLDAPIANLCFLLGKAFQQPDTFDREDPRLLSEALEASKLDSEPECMELVQQWQRALNSDTTPLLRDYARLFLGPFEIRAAPYATFYLDPEQRLMGVVSQEVSQYYIEAGLGPREDQPCDAPDHIVTECEFLYYLAHQCLTQSNSEQWFAHFQRFSHEHFACWLDGFCEAILAVEDTQPFYPALARFTLRFKKMLMQVQGI